MTTTRPRKIGCRSGCPLDHHEPPCSKAYPDPPVSTSRAATDAVARTSYDLGYREGHRAGYEAGLLAGRREPVVIRGEAMSDDLALLRRELAQQQADERGPDDEPSPPPPPDG